jgi:cell division protease FtsH
MNTNNQAPRGSPTKGRSGILWIVLSMALLFYLFRGMGSSTNAMNMPYSQFRQAVMAGNVAEVNVRGDRIVGKFKQPVVNGAKQGPAKYKQFQTTIPSFGDSGLMSLLEKKNVTVQAESSKASGMTTFLLWMLPLFLIIGFFIYSSKKMGGIGGMGGRFLDFSKSKAKLYARSSVNTTFKDVAGLTNAKKEMEEIIEFLKEPSKFLALGGKLPKGLLLAGPPGIGKTLLAKAAAGEANVPFYSISGSEFVEMFVGVGASRVRDMFANAKKNAPSIIFIDEIDSIGRVRGTGLGGGHDEREQTLNQILSEMDGFSTDETIIVIAATNRPDILDPALVRPGRFDRRITLDLPQKKARKEILEIHVRKMPLAEGVDLERIADMTVGFSGADLENLANEAALLAARKGKHKIEAEDFEQSRDKVIMGLEREEIINEREKLAIARHEAGHALLAKLIPGVDPLQKVTIVPRGHALGATEQIPVEDQHNLSRSYLLNRVAIMLGGRIAEKLIYHDITTGAGDDLKKATSIVRRMVTQWGMSDHLGPVTFSQGEEHPFLGRDLAQPKDFSEHTARIIDEEVERILGEMEGKAEKILRENIHKLEAIAQALVKHETLDNKEVDDILAGLDRKEEKESEMPETDNPLPWFAPKPTDGRISSLPSPSYLHDGTGDLPEKVTRG